MVLRCLLGVTFVLACCPACTTVDSAPPTAANHAAPAPAPVVLRESVITRLDDPELDFVCAYESPTGSRLNQLVCRKRADVAEQCEEAQAALGTMPTGCIAQ